MSQYCENHSLLKLTQDGRLNVNCSISLKKIDSQYKLSTKKTVSPKSFTLSSSKNLEKQYHHYCNNSFGNKSRLNISQAF